MKLRRTARRTLTTERAPEPGTPEFSRVQEILASTTSRDGNRIEVLQNGCQIFPAMVESIRSAQDTIVLSTYIWWGGEAAKQIALELAERAAAGVQVKVVLDAFGSMRIDHSILATLHDAGIHTVWFRPIRWHQVRKMNNRLHRRILVIDGRTALVGGVGIAAEWEGDCERPESWRETHLRIEGPAVRDLLGAFAESWAEATGEILTGRHLPVLTKSQPGVSAMITRSSSAKGSTALEQLFQLAISSARHRLWITTAYFAPSFGFVDQLCAAAQRGVDVRLLVNGRPIDKEVVRKASQHSYEKLLSCGVRIFEYEKARLHAKVIVADERWANVGSANFDVRSLALEDEVTVSVRDEKIATQLADQFLKDTAQSNEITLATWRKRPLTNRLGEQAAELVRHSL